MCWAKKCAFDFELWKDLKLLKKKEKSNTRLYELKITAKIHSKPISSDFQFSIRSIEQHWIAIFLAINHFVRAVFLLRQLFLKLWSFAHSEEFIFALIYVYHNFLVEHGSLSLRQVFHNEKQHLVCIRRARSIFLFSFFKYSENRSCFLRFFILNVRLRTKICLH